MPSTMIHLAVARKFNPDAKASFYIGNIAPDAVYTREEKDAVHFRGEEDRLASLCEFAEGLDLDHGYDLGYLMHLYTDYIWDSTALSDFIKHHGEGWFRPYRNEITLAGCWLYNRDTWGCEVFDMMHHCPDRMLSGGYNMDIANLRWYIDRNRKGHTECSDSSSPFYTPEYVDDFIKKVHIKFNQWLMTVR